MARKKHSKPEIEVTSRPVGYDADIAEKILDRIADGELLIEICRDESMPTRRQFHHWRTIHRDLAEAYAGAREAWADYWAERVIDISFNPPPSGIDQEGRLIIDHAAVGLAKLQTDNLKWLTGKYHPRTFGDRPTAELAPAEQPAPIAQIKRIIIDPKESAPTEPLRLSYDPGPLPQRLDEEILARVIRCVKTNVPQASDRDPRELLEEVICVIGDALAAHYGT